MGAVDYHYIVEHIDNLKGSIIEIGSNRGEGSTMFFAGLVYNRKDLDFYTIDIESNIQSSLDVVSSRVKNMQNFCMTGE